MADLDSLLVDLEESIEHRGSASSAGASHSQQFTDFVNNQKDLQGRRSVTINSDPRSNTG